MQGPTNALESNVAKEVVCQDWFVASTCSYSLPLVAPNGSVSLYILLTKYRPKVGVSLSLLSEKDWLTDSRNACSLSAVQHVTYLISTTESH